MAEVSAGPLDRYRAKRDPARTPEPGLSPGGEARERPAEGWGEGRRFVIQEHHARRLHWDFRLERDGVLVSWALPRGVPLDPSENRLAVPTEDHPLEYLSFSGTIPAGSYGAGTVSIWDRGTYDCHKWGPGEVQVTLHGERVRGRHVLFRTGERTWMLHRMDPPQDPGAGPLPQRIEPMLAVPAPELPTDEGWAYEIKWDGVRAIAFVSGGQVRLQGRRLVDITPAYPELARLGRALGSRRVALDGEVVVLGPGGRPDFGLVQRRMHVRDQHATRRLATRLPVTYMIFDLLHLDGRDTMPWPYEERRAALDDLGLGAASGPAPPVWQVPRFHVGDGAALAEASRAQGLEGMVAKRLGSPYRPGRRSPNWRKVKHLLRQAMVVGGWLPGEGRRSGEVGALVVGYWEGGRLRYAGRVGTGFSEADLRHLTPVLEGIAREESPFDPPPRLAGPASRQVRFVEPVLVAEVAFSEWTHTGTVRHPRFVGMRQDRDPEEVGRES